MTQFDFLRGLFSLTCCNITEFRCPTGGGHVDGGPDMHRNRISDIEREIQETIHENFNTTRTIKMANDSSNIYKISPNGTVNCLRLVYMLIL